MTTRKKSILDQMNVGQIVELHSNVAVMRVPGGWIFNQFFDSDEVTSTFVPDPYDTKTIQPKA